MTLTIKRSVNIEVVVNASFKKKYILLLNKLITQLDQKIANYRGIDTDAVSYDAFKPFLNNKLNETILQKEQLKQQIEVIKLCKDGESFLLTTLDGQQEVNEGQSSLDLIAPALITLKDDVVASIKA